ncbi:helix-turn-helix domain-containing protein [Jhaorihella thermophila]|uniref:DNA binding domain-containing protein, excisionase family n=1 Tax=Jhaorihella thermophila TaxID=488547 RepID=A0A1H5ZB86_9RHOB|nr:helix-turn-helix domain-containing protein [Jhaorihella thermophila]SEG33334.1 DNA binding domain-containing protein, excisionase family [Jhaorihella thermophila]
MTINANLARKFGDGLPTDTDRAAADQLRRLLVTAMTEARTEEGVAVSFVDPETRRKAEIILSPHLAQLFIELLRHISDGDAVTLIPVSKMLTTQQAADILNVSRPHLIKLLRSEDNPGGIPFEMIGRHRRIRATDLFEFKRKRDEERTRALDELMAADADLI